MRKWTVYAIACIEKRYIYVGMTENMERRFKQHESGSVRSTKAYKPFRIIYTEVYDSRIEARQREVYLKSGIGKEYLKQLL